MIASLLASHDLEVAYSELESILAASGRLRLLSELKAWLTNSNCAHTLCTPTVPTSTTASAALKERGVVGLSERQAIANAFGKQLRMAAASEGDATVGARPTIGARLRGRVNSQHSDGGLTMHRPLPIQFHAIRSDEPYLIPCHAIQIQVHPMPFHPKSCRLVPSHPIPPKPISSDSATPQPKTLCSIRIAIYSVPSRPTPSRPIPSRPMTPHPIVSDPIPSHLHTQHR